MDSHETDLVPIDEETQQELAIPPPRLVGRPKGSKNKITSLKLMAEEAARDRNHDRIQYVIDLIITEAAKGSVSAQKLVWGAVMSQGISNEDKKAEKLEININTASIPQIKEVKEPDIIITPTLVTKEEDNET